MRKILILVMLGIFLLPLSCKEHFEAEYTLNCQFSSLDFDSRLVVMDYKGYMLETFNIPHSTTSFSAKVSTSDPDSPDFYDLHLIYPDPISGQSQGFAYIYTQLGVKNGAQVFLSPMVSTNTMESDQFGALILRDIASLEQFELPAYPTNNFVHTYYDADAFLQAFFIRSAGQGVLVRASANGESIPRQKYLADSLLNFPDFIELSWNDLKPVDNFQDVKMPNGLNCTKLEVSAVSEDFKSYVKLWPPSNTAPMLGFSIPEGLPASSHFVVRAEAENQVFERIFKPGEAFEFKNNDIGIVSWDNIETLNIQTQGPVDLVTLEGSYAGNYWKINGSPEEFKQKKLPDLSRWVSNWNGVAPFFQNGTIHVYNFDLYEYEQVLAGFPFRSSELFAFARSGYSENWKVY